MARISRLLVIGAALVGVVVTPGLANAAPGPKPPGPNIGNFGACVVTQPAPAGMTKVEWIKAQLGPGVFIQTDGKTIFFPRNGTACAVNDGYSF